MVKGIVVFSGTLFLIFSALLSGYPQKPLLPPVRVMFYNVENFFDIYDDTLTEDNDFLPSGLMRWNYSRYKKKLNLLYKTIMAAGDWSPPAIVAMCEIENRRVLQDLIDKTNLYKFDYEIIHEDSPDERGIDVSLIFRKDLIKILFFRYLIPTDSNGILKTRSVLYSKCLIYGDTLHLFVNHWPSRRGGVLAGESDRIIISDLVKNICDSISRNQPGAKILITGDLNCVPEDPVIKRLITVNGNGSKLENLSDSLSSTGTGSYRYSGTWEMIDQVIVSDFLLNDVSGLSASRKDLKVFKPDFLLMADPNYPGLRPFSTFRGYRYQGGFSDHLAILLDLRFK